MEQRNAVALVALVALGVFAAYYVVSASGLVPVPGTDYLNIKLTAGVDCGAAWMCWFNQGLQVNYVPDFQYALKRLLVYCGPGASSSPVKATLDIEAPNYALTHSEKESNLCEGSGGNLEFTWNIPLDKGMGVYKFTAKVCGMGYWSQNVCATKEFTYNYGG